ncbi:hypothetical protein [Myxococcus sp. CA040A]|uniref:hypothetical protein n=1 Tax=Myxococcus sp. CA040A TaxID=2741738 RepID=UPI00157AA26E|nr:hypothetical protein [Myxococcus sp. CA040A]NTX04899.1 hypothetical protein [Myxococcus sp. CA040A]
MTKNIFNAAMVLVGTASVLTGCNFDQPEAPCFVQDNANWVVKYDAVDSPTLVNGGGACTIVAPPGELLGVFKFNDPDNLNNSLLTIRPNGLASIASRDPGAPSEQTALGALATEPDDKDFCAAPSLSAATVNAAATSTAAATTLRYEFTNVDVYAAPFAPGTQLKGELKYTKDGCASNYTMRALWPAIACSPSDATACGPDSGLNPDFAAECLTIRFNADGTPAASYCVPSKQIPSFR